MGAGDKAAAVLAEKFSECRPHADERSWRLYLGSEARAHAALSGCTLAVAWRWSRLRPAYRGRW
jgi:hypothetical protein